MAGTWACRASLALCCIALLWAGRAEADPGILACTHGADGEYATFEMYSERTASLRGKVGEVEFNCPVRVEHVNVCGPRCHVPLDFTVQALLDPDGCSTQSLQWVRDTLNPRPNIKVMPRGSRMFWRRGEASVCTALRVDPAFAESLGVEARNASAPPDDIAAYVGLYPHDEVGGVAFLEHPLVEAAVSRLAAGDGQDAMRWINDPAAPKLPIERRGDWLLSSGCRAHACPAHHWTLYVAADGSGAEACYADPERPHQATWYRAGAGTLRLPTPGSPPCPIPYAWPDASSR